MPDFNEIIQAGRERRKNEALAERIFSRNRPSASSVRQRASPGPSLASRVGVRKTTPKPQSGARLNSASHRSTTTKVPGGNVNGEWTHDLHDSVRGRNSSLTSRQTRPDKGRTSLAELDNMDLDPDAARQQHQQASIVRGSSTRTMGLSIKGLAGPFVVMAQNFAPGTTLADIESAMTPIGGEMESCRLIKTNPFIIVEMVFASREGGERVIETFNGKTADGRLIKVYPKPGGYQPLDRNKPPPNAPSGPQTSRVTNHGNNQIVDGSMGFGDGSGQQDLFFYNDTTNRPLYSDKLVTGSKRGRGSRQGRGGR